MGRANLTLHPVHPFFLFHLRERTLLWVSHPAFEPLLFENLINPSFVFTPPTAVQWLVPPLVQLGLATVPADAHGSAVPPNPLPIPFMARPKAPTLSTLLRKRRDRSVANSLADARLFMSLPDHLRGPPP